MSKRILFLLPAILMTLAGCVKVESAKPIEGEVPSARQLLTVVNPRGLKTHLIHYSGMNVNFNSDTHNANWVAWELTADEVKGEEPRAKQFRTDTNVNGSATPDDYRNSGYDRGHLAPAGDMKWGKLAMEETFYMTNIVPQNRSLNRKAWNKLEQKCRLRAERDSAVYIICGPVPGDTPLAHIGVTQVEVPARLFKVVLSPYAKPARGIGFIFSNTDDHGGMQECAVSIDEVERITGYDFFSALPDSLENQLESQCNFHQWSNIPKK